MVTISKGELVRRAISALGSDEFLMLDVDEERLKAREELKTLEQNLDSPSIELNAQIALGKLREKLLALFSSEQAGVVGTMMEMIFFSDSTWSR